MKPFLWEYLKSVQVNTKKDIVYSKIEIPISYVISYENEKNFLISSTIRRNATRIIEHIMTIA